MNTNDLISQVTECRSERWQNSDISRGGERLLEILAAHMQECEECRDAFDAEEYEEDTLIDLWHRYMCQTEDISEWICEEGLQALFDHPLDVFVIVPAQEGVVGYPRFVIELSEPALEYEVEKRWPGAEMGDFELCEEPEASEDEYVMMVTVGGETVARVYTQEA